MLLEEGDEGLDGDHRYYEGDEGTDSEGYQVAFVLGEEFVAFHLYSVDLTFL